MFVSSPMKMAFHQSFKTSSSASSLILNNTHITFECNEETSASATARSNGMNEILIKKHVWTPGLISQSLCL